MSLNYNAGWNLKQIIMIYCNIYMFLEVINRGTLRNVTPRSTEIKEVRRM